jgi:hypothetical protein
VLSSIVLAVLLVIGGVEQNPGPGVEAENAIQLVCTGCGRNLKSGFQCELCGSWYHYSCGSIKVQMAEREKWSCEKFKTERFLKLQEDLQSALRQTDDLKFRSRELEVKLLLVAAGKRDTVPAKQKSAKCMWLVTQCCALLELNTDMMVECFPEIRTEELHRVIEQRDLGSPETAIIHVVTNDLRAVKNLDFVMGEVYALVATAKSKLPNCRLVLSGVLRRRDVSWRSIGALNDRFDWVANALEITFVDPNSWIEEGISLEMGCI